MEKYQQEVTATPEPRSDLLSRRQAARYLGVSGHTLEVWASARRYALAYVKIGRLVKYRKSDLDQFVSDNLVGGVK